jgi:predicted transposase YbfD/YdcC
MEYSMSQKKGKVPAHIQLKQFEHPGIHSSWVFILNRVEDPRQPSCNTRHSVTTILFIVFITVLCGAKNWEEMYYLAEGEDFAKWLSSYVDLSGGIPSRWTLERVVSLIPTAQLQPLFALFKEHAKKMGTIAIDGKTLCGSRSWGKGHPIHLLHAWSVEEGVCLAQIPVNEKSNEITAFPDLLSQLELKGAVVTADAIHTQKESIKTVIDKKADYAFPVKKNHPGLLEDIKLLFAEADAVQFKGIDAAHTETLEKKGGRVESRRYELLSAEELPGISEWAGCRCVGRVTRKRTKRDKTSEEVVYYITSLDFDAEQFGKSTRSHWGVENGLHWALDVIFREDGHRYQARVGAANLSLIRKIALGILSRDMTVKKGRATKQMKAMGSASYRDHLLRNCF